MLYIHQYCYCGLQYFKDAVVINDSIVDEKIVQLNKLKQMEKQLLEKLRKSKYNSQKNVKRLFTNWSGVIHEKEVGIDKNVLAYNTNKGEKINICLKNPVTKTEITDINTMYFVLLHELAHVMTNDYKHNKEFWDNYRFLIKFSIDNGLYEYVNYNTDPVYFCGNSINYNPYSNKENSEKK